MISFIYKWLPRLWLLDGNPVDRILQGLVGACGISVLCNLMKVHLFVQAFSATATSEGDSKESSWPGGKVGRMGEVLRFCCLTGLLSLVGQRVASLVVLEFSIRAFLALVNAGSSTLPGNTLPLLVQCQFSLGCALSCSLHFLQQGALHCTLNLLLAGGLSLLLAGPCQCLWDHVVSLYPQHRTQNFCGVCILLSATASVLLALVCRAVFLAFAVAAVASFAIVNHHFLSEVEALKFWTPLIICYSLLVVYSQKEQQRRSGVEALLHTAALRLGALLVLELSVGRWVDVLQVLIALLGEALCLLPSQDLLQPLLQKKEQETPSKSS